MHFCGAKRLTVWGICAILVSACTFLVHFLFAGKDTSAKGVLSVKDHMINDEEPILRMRTGVDAHKVTTSPLHPRTVRLVTYAYRVIILTVIGLAIGVLYSSAQEGIVQKPTQDPATQRYNACVFGKGLAQEEQTVDAAVFAADEECLRLSDAGHIVALPEDPMAVQLEELLAGAPMAQMAEALAEQDQKVAALMVGIAHIESKWGRYAPRKGGTDCYNYWGIKTSGTRGAVAGGYGCFGTPDEAVAVVGSRLHRYVYESRRDTPAKMVTPWKCGSSCASHTPESVARWVGTVQTYYNRVMAMDAAPAALNPIGIKTQKLTLGN